MLLEVIKENVKEGCTIYSNSCKGYFAIKVEEEKFQHFKINRKYHFIEIGIHAKKSHGCGNAQNGTAST